MMKTTTASSATVVTSGLDPYAGPGTRLQASHLLRRATFGPTREEIIDAIKNGLDATIAT